MRCNMESCSIWMEWERRSRSPSWLCLMATGGGGGGVASLSLFFFFFSFSFSEPSGSTGDVLRPVAMSCITLPPSAMAIVCMPRQMPRMGICRLYANCVMRSSGRSRTLFTRLSCGEGSSPAHSGLKSAPPESSRPSMSDREFTTTSVSDTGGMSTGIPPASTTCW